MGAPKERLDLLEVKEDNDTYTWQTVGRIWASVEVSGKNNLFSKVGIGARSANIVTVPRPEISLHHALRWRGEHLFLTELLHQGPTRLSILAARIGPRNCIAFRPEKTRDELGRPSYEQRERFRFPACVTEKWMGYSQKEPQAESGETLVLVTPKAVMLEVGDLVEIEELGRYAVQVLHRLDEYKNEYEAARVRDA